MWLFPLPSRSALPAAPTDPVTDCDSAAEPADPAPSPFPLRACIIRHVCRRLARRHGWIAEGVLPGHLQGGIRETTHKQKDTRAIQRSESLSQSDSEWSQWTDSLLAARCCCFRRCNRCSVVAVVAATAVDVIALRIPLRTRARRSCFVRQRTNRRARGKPKRIVGHSLTGVDSMTVVLADSFALAF